MISTTHKHITANTIVRFCRAADVFIVRVLTVFSRMRAIQPTNTVRRKEQASAHVTENPSRTS
jgi:hypothetical protein